MKALCAYEASGQSDAFCKSNFLHARNLREMSELQRQLKRLLRLQQTSAALRNPLVAELHGIVTRDRLDDVLPPPSSAVQSVLRRAMAAGWADQVSRRVRSSEYVQRVIKEEGKKHHAVRYQPCIVEEEVRGGPMPSTHM